MNNREIVKHFYEVVAPGNHLDEISKYISEGCVQRPGEKETFIGIEGLKQYFLTVKKLILISLYLL